MGSWRNMEFAINLLVGVGFLIMLSIIDFLTFNKKKGYIPSVLTTSFLIVMFILGGTATTIFFGILAGLLALLFTDLEMWGGIADYKVFVAGGMAFSLISNFLTFAVFVVVLSFIAKYIFASFVIKKKEKAKDFRFPFIPIILLAYCLTILLMVVLNL